MDKNLLRKEILALIANISRQSDALGNENETSRPRMEIFLQEVEKLYQKSIVFNHLNLYDATANQDHLRSQQIAPPPLPNQPVPSNQLVDENIKLSEKVAAKDELPAKKDELPELVEGKIEKRKENVGETIQRSSITDLKSSIGINDQFLFANELFNGNMQEYSVAIQQLNTCDTYESAMLYIQSLQQLYNWDPKNKTQKRLLELIDRRYN